VEVASGRAASNGERAFALQLLSQPGTVAEVRAVQRHARSWFACVVARVCACVRAAGAAACSPARSMQVARRTPADVLASYDARQPALPSRDALRRSFLDRCVSRNAGCEASPQLPATDVHAPLAGLGRSRLPACNERRCMASSRIRTKRCAYSCCLCVCMPLACFPDASSDTVVARAARPTRSRWSTRARLLCRSCCPPLTPQARPLVAARSPFATSVSALSRVARAQDSSRRSCAPSHRSCSLWMSRCADEPHGCGAPGAAPHAVSIRILSARRSRGFTRARCITWCGTRACARTRHESRHCGAIPFP
jgi:hypothetical protein